MDSPSGSEKPLRIPPWLRIRLPERASFRSTCKTLADRGLHTVCQSARCPNIFECFQSRVATFLILGPTCTRNCAFCNIESRLPAEPDPAEPGKVAEAARELDLAHVVVTSVTRDDLPDGGSFHWRAVLEAVAEALPAASREALIPDFRGDAAALDTVLAAGPQILNHNVETVARLYPAIRPQADYRQSLELLARARARTEAAGEGRTLTKSGLMVGLGEEDDEVRGVLADLAAAGCDIVTVGQYMRPSLAHPPVQRYVHPEVFEQYAAWGAELGLTHVFAAPLVRSSYNAAAVYKAVQSEK